MTATGINSKHLAQGSVLPPLNPGTLRVYNMRFCPFAQRTVNCLLAKGVDFEVVNVNLKSKPDWFLAKNPLGKVPMLEKDGDIIYESAICNEFLDDANIGKRIAPKDAVSIAQQKMLMERLNKITMSLFGVLRAPEDEVKIKAMVDALHICEQLLQANYYSGVDCGVVDYMLWPWFERLCVLQHATNGKVNVDEHSFPKLTAFMQRMMDRPEIKSYALTLDQHLAFLTTYLKGDPNYDILSSSL